MEIVGYEVDESGSLTSFSLWVVHELELLAYNQEDVDKLMNFMING